MNLVENLTVTAVGDCGLLRFSVCENLILYSKIFSFVSNIFLNGDVC